MDSLWIKFIGIGLNVIGSLLFTIRATKIIGALSIVAQAHELNIQQLMPNHQENIVNLGNSTAHVDRAKGKKLLILGVILIVAGLFLQGVSTYMDVQAKQTEPTMIEQGSGGNG